MRAAVYGGEISKTSGEALPIRLMRDLPGPPGRINARPTGLADTKADDRRKRRAGALAVLALNPLNYMQSSIGKDGLECETWPF
jgi:hypothetical protein